MACAKDKMLGIVLAWGIASLLPGCSLSPIISSDSTDYNHTIEQVSNSSLVINILRGRDQAPLYFPDLSQVRGSLEASASLEASLPWGPRFGADTRRSFQGGPVSISTNPSFDIAPNNTKQFYQGLLNPISQNLFFYFLDRYRGIGTSRYVFYLLVDSIDVIRNGRPTKTITWREDDFNNRLDRWFRDRTGDVGPRIVPLRTNPKALGPPVKADADSILKAEAAGLDVRAVGSDRIQIQRKTSNLVLCMPEDGGYVPVRVVANSTVGGQSGELSYDEEDRRLRNEACSRNIGLGTSAADGVEYAIRLRSVEQVFYFLGNLVNPASRYRLRQDPPYRDCPLIPFYILEQQEEHTRLSVVYQGRTYYISNIQRIDNCGRRDNTLTVLSIVNDLLNLNRDANDLPTTRAVQVVNR